MQMLSIRYTNTLHCTG